MMLSDSTRSNGHNLKHRMFPLNIRKQFFTVRVTKRWHSLPREVVASPSLEILKSDLDIVLRDQLKVALLQERGWARSPEVPSNLSCSVIQISFSLPETFIDGHQKC